REPHGLHRGSYTRGRHRRRLAAALPAEVASAAQAGNRGIGLMRTLDRLVVATFLKLWVAVTLATPPLFILGDFTENLDSYLDRGLTRAEVGLAYLYKLPEYLQ